jgi:hypothetical protein
MRTQLILCETNATQVGPGFPVFKRIVVPALGVSPCPVIPGILF